MPRTITRRLVQVVAVVAVLGCADHQSPTGPRPRAEPSRPALATAPTAPVTRAPVLLRTDPLGSDVLVSMILWPGGGMLKVAQAGLTVTFPAGAVSVPTQLSVRAHAGKLVVYTFEPHGITFGAPITLHQTLRGTSAELDPVLQQQLQGGYLAGDLGDIDAAGIGSFAETFPAKLFMDNRKSMPTQVSFQTTHFSGYAFASGKTTTLDISY